MSTLSPFLVLRVHSMGEVISISRPVEVTRVNKAARERRRETIRRIFGSCKRRRKKAVQVLESANVHPMKVGGKGLKEGSAHRQASAVSAYFPSRFPQFAASFTSEPR